MSYKTLGYGMVEKVIANCDKCSARGQSNVVISPWGVFTMYKSNARGRFYSLKGSKFFTNRGSLKIGTIKRMLRSLLGK